MRLCDFVRIKSCCTIQSVAIFIVVVILVVVVVVVVVVFVVVVVVVEVRENPRKATRKWAENGERARKTKGEKLGLK